MANTLRARCDRLLDDVGLEKSATLLSDVKAVAAELGVDYVALGPTLKACETELYGAGGAAAPSPAAPSPAAPSPAALSPAAPAAAAPSDDDDDEELECQTFTAEELAKQRYEAAKAKNDITEIDDDDDDDEPPAPARSRKRRRVAVESSDEEYDEDEDESPAQSRKRGRGNDLLDGLFEVEEESEEESESEEEDEDEFDEEEEEDESEEEEESDEDVSFVRVTPAKRQRRSAPRRSAPSGPTVAQLKEACRSMGLKVGGTKVELARRLLNPKESDQAGYRPLKANAQNRYYINGRRVGPKEYHDSGW